VGLALATDLTAPQSQPKVVGLMYVMLLLGTIASALIFGALLADFSPGRLVQVIQGSAVATLLLNAVALWKQEPLGRVRRAAAGTAAGAASAMPADASTAGFAQSWQRFLQGAQARRRLVVVGLGTMAFSMEEVLLEPYGGEVLGMGVGSTTRLTAALAVGGLLGFGLASRVLGRGYDPFRMAGHGVLAGIVAFLAVIAAAPVGSPLLFAIGTLGIGFGAGLFGHGTLTATMRLAPPDQAGLALGAWGAVQATAAGLGIALGGLIKDGVSGFASMTPLGAAVGYEVVYALEVALLVATLLAMGPLVRREGVRPERVSQGI
jgi:MFS transporter, BCD family, chlorophyll transporter